MLPPMDGRPVDVVMPGAEGEWLVRALVDAGFVARRRRPGASPMDPAPRLLLVAVGPEEDPGALLSSLRAGQSIEELPIILVGGSQVGLEWARELGVASFVQRPVTISRLVAEVESVSAPNDPLASTGSAVINARRDGSRAKGVSLRTHDTVVTEGPGVLVLEASVDPRFSERLRALFARADRTLFPDRPALKPTSRGAHDGVSLTAAELVPDEVFAARQEASGDEALGHLPGEATFVGGAPALGDATSVAARRDVEVGSLVEGRVVELLHELASATAAQALCLDLPGGRRLELTIDAGRITRFDGSVALALWARLRDELVLEGDEPEDELAAHRALEAECDAGRLGRYELDRALRLAREALLYQVVAAPALRYRLARADIIVGSEPRMLVAALLPLVFEGMRRGVRSSEAMRWLDVAERSLAFTPETRERLIEAAIEPELIAYLERYEGAAVSDVIDDISPHAGVAGLLVALHRSSALEFGPRVARRPGAGERRLRAGLIARHRRAVDGDYFSLLGLSRDASFREVEAAYREGRAYLDGLLGLSAGQPSLDRLRVECVDALDDAFEVLRSPSIREAYAAALP